MRECIRCLQAIFTFKPPPLIGKLCKFQYFGSTVDDQELEKFTAEFFFSFFSRTTKYLSLGLYNGGRSLQPANENNKALQNGKFLNFFLFLWVICALLDRIRISGSGFRMRIRIRIHWPDWIRSNPDPKHWWIPKFLYYVHETDVLSEQNIWKISILESRTHLQLGTLLQKHSHNFDLGKLFLFYLTDRND